MKNFLKTLALLCGSFLIALPLGEILVRIAAPQRVDSVRAIFEADDDVVFKLQRNLSITYSQFEFEVHESTNSLGFRDRALVRKPQGGYRVMGLGDSFSYANGVNIEETYFKLVELCLTASAGRPVEIINCAVPAYSLIQEVRTLKKFSPTLDPDAVILGFYVGNDFIDSYQLFDEKGKPTVSVLHGDLASTKLSDQEGGIRGLIFPVREYLATRSNLYIFLRNRFSELFAKFAMRAPPPPPDFCAKEYSGEMKKGWDLDQNLLLDLANYTGQHNMRLTVVILPAIYQVYEEAWKQYFTAFHVSPDRYDLNKPQALLGEFCAQHNIECIDVLPKMRAEGKGKQLYYRIDSHLNPEGHRVVADTLCRYFSRQPVAGRPIVR